MHRPKELPELPDHLKVLQSRVKIRQIIEVFRNSDNWSNDARRKKTSRQWKLKQLYENIEARIGQEKIIDYLLESNFWHMIPELRSASTISNWMTNMKEPFLCIEPFLMEIAHAENIANDLKIMSKRKRRAQ